MGAHELPLLRKREDEMDEQRRLQYPSDYVAPVNRPVEVVQLAGVFEGIRDKRNQAEDVEVRRAGRGPAS